jgi:hypothetical protein
VIDKIWREFVVVIRRYEEEGEDLQQVILPSYTASSLLPLEM